MRSTFVVSVASLSVLLAGILPANAAHEGDYGPAVTPTWETSVDPGQRTDVLGEFAVTSYTANNSVPGVFVAGTGLKNQLLRNAGIDDFDLVTTMFDAATGEARWTNTYDHDTTSLRFSSDRPVGMEVNYNNNLLYVLGSTVDGLIINSQAVSTGKIDNTFVYGGAPTINDTAISVAGSTLFAVGKTAADFHVLRWNTGAPAITLDVRPVVGEAKAVDANNDYNTGDTTSWRTIVATGRADVPGSAGDVYTVAYETSKTTPSWVRRWASPAGATDEGTAVDVSYDRANRRGVAFVSGRTGSASTGWDIWIVGYDLASGNPLWSGPNDGMRTFDSGFDDAAIDVAYATATQRVYVTGTSLRGAPHAQDIVTLAFDALTGDQVGVAYAAGDISNGRDTPTDLTVTADGQRVFVGARVHTKNLSHAYRAGVFAYDARLRPAGTGMLTGGGASLDAVAGIGISLDGSHLLVGGASDLSNTRLDHTGAAFEVASFIAPVDPDPVPTTLIFTSNTATTATVGDETTIEVLLTDADGAPVVADVAITFDGGDATTVATDADGLARLIVTPERGGVADVTASFAGRDLLLATQAATQIDVARRATDLVFTDATDRNATIGDAANVEVLLTDATTGDAIAEQSVVITVGDDAPQAVMTNAEGLARLSHTPSSAGQIEVVAHTAGTAQREPARATTTVEVSRRSSAMTLDVIGKNKSRTLTARLVDRDGAPLAGRTVVFSVDGVEVARGQTGADGSTTIAAPKSAWKDDVTIAADFAGDASHTGSHAERPAKVGADHNND